MARLTRSPEVYKEVLDHMLEDCQIIGPDWTYLYVNQSVATHGHVAVEDFVGRKMTDVYPGIDRTPLFATLERCMTTRTAARFTSEISHPDGSTEWFELSIQPVPAGLFVMSVDVTSQKAAERLLQSKVQRLTALRSIDLAILNHSDARPALKVVVERTKQLLDAEAVAILQLDPDAQTYEVAVGDGIGDPVFMGLRVPVGTGILKAAVSERRTISTGPNFPLSERDPLRVLIGVVNVQVCITPLVSQSTVLGAMVVVLPPAFVASQDWLEFFEALAGQAAMAIGSEDSFAKLQDAYETTLEGWSRALDLRDEETEGHTRRVTELTVRLAREAGLPEAEIVHVRRGALLHDIGKIGVPDAILLKGDKLTEEEWAAMRRHPTIAYELLLPIAYLRPALDIPYCHHEKWDGTGYPRQLRGNDIPLTARLFSVVDVWDALRSDRPYRKRWTDDHVVDYLRHERGTHFDPAAVDLFLRLNLTGGP